MSLSRPQRERIAELINGIEVAYIMIEGSEADFARRGRWVKARRADRQALWQEFGIETRTEYDIEAAK